MRQDTDRGTSKPCVEVNNMVLVPLTYIFNYGSPSSFIAVGLAGEQ